MSWSSATGDAHVPFMNRAGDTCSAPFRYASKAAGLI